MAVSDLVIHLISVHYNVSTQTFGYHLQENCISTDYLSFLVYSARIFREKNVRTSRKRERKLFAFFLCAKKPNSSKVKLNSKSESFLCKKKNFPEFPRDFSSPDRNISEKTKKIICEKALHYHLTYDVVLLKLHTEAVQLCDSFAKHETYTLKIKK